MTGATLCVLVALASSVATIDVTTLTSEAESSTSPTQRVIRWPVFGWCGGPYCQCKTTTYAECFGNFYQASEIPRLPFFITKLMLQFFYLPHISTEAAKNLMALPLQELRLEYCDIESIEPEVLANFRNLRVLSLSNNELFSERALHTALEGLSNLTLKALELRYMKLKSLFPLSSMGSATVSKLYLSYNFFPILNLTALRDLEGLSVLEVKSSYVKDFHPVFLPNLTELRLEDNDIDFIDFCPNGTVFFPRLERLFLQRNNIRSLLDNHLRCLSSLRVFDVSSNRLYYLMGNTFSTMRNLEMVRMEKMKGDYMFSLQAFVFNNSNLLALAMNDINLSMDEDEEANFLAGCTNLTDLQISGNDLSPYSNQKLSAFFAEQKQLETLAAERCRLKQFPNFLSNLPKLTSLDLSGNTFTKFSEALPRAVQNRLKFVDLSDNPYQCSCDLMWLKEWIARNTTTFYHYPDSYVCANPPHAGTLLADFHISAHACFWSQTRVQVAVALSVLLFLALVIAPVIYRYRWHIQYLVFMLRYNRHRQNGGDPEEEPINYRYDAFVIYDSAQHEWVVRHLMPALEEREGLRLCLHERDFLAGKLIVDNIVDSITASRKVIAVMSEALAASEWCQFELSLSHRLVLERGRDLMVVVMLEKIARGHLTRTMYAVLKTTTYISWPDEERAMEAFWNRLAEAVRN